MVGESGTGDTGCAVLYWIGQWKVKEVAPAGMDTGETFKPVHGPDTCWKSETLLAPVTQLPDNSPSMIVVEPRHAGARGRLELGRVVSFEVLAGETT